MDVCLSEIGLFIIFTSVNNILGCNVIIKLAAKYYDSEIMSYGYENYMH